ncbi:hypothetical protein C8Q80DRAFT_660233 [Daedaleopsis nitida]|nr:hypothetical protein C8Q80DRAFT_660233 [Daedaleopsis nitida]
MMGDSTSRPPSVAIVGIAAQLPSGKWADADLDYQSFFDFLLDKGEAYEPIPTSRFNIEKIKGRATGQVLADTGAFLKDVEMFDHMELGVTAKDARLMPLSTRKLIEATFLSLYDSGIDYKGKNIGCYMSGVAHDIFSVSGHDDAEATSSFGYVPSMVANRVSYHLDLRGPTVPLDTACSSSMYATHLAVQAIRNGECDAAVVGGCQMNHRFTEWLTYTQGGILSPDGKCKPFDVSANGFGRGEGVVVIVVKPLDAALRDHEHIYGTILGTGVNSSGALVPANAPAAVAQRDAMLRAFRQADRLPQEVDFLELHATGTAQGDPTEANWVGAEFQRDGELLLGSVKGNIGHLEITSFLASLCKVCGMLERGVVPPNVNLTRPNSAIRWSQYRLRVPVEPEPLSCRGDTGRSLIAMTSSGIGGANGHAVVEGPPPALPPTAFWTEGTEPPALLLASGLSPRSATAVGDLLLGTASASSEKTALARIYGRRVRSMTWRSYSVLAPSKTSKFSKPVITPKARPPIVFVFSGQGTQHFQMGRQLFGACAPFRESILELDQVYASVVGASLIETTGLFTDTHAETSDTLGNPWPIAITLPALTMLQLALVDALAAVGVRPDAVVGHSAGETAVLSASGAASKAAALELAIARGRALSLVEEAKGTMAAVSCSPKDARTIIEEVQTELGQGVLEVGCFNTSNAVTLSGAESHIDLAVAKATAAGIFARKLKTRVPVHSEMMNLCRDELEKLLAVVFSRHNVSTPTVAAYSTMTGQAFTGAFDAQYYWDGTIGPVRFKEAISAMSAKYKTMTFVEIGPHPVLTSYLQSITGDREDIAITCPLRRPRAPEPGAEVFEFLTALGKVATAGHNCVDFDVLYGGSRSFTGSLPAYPFAPKSIPWFVASPEIARQRQHRNGPMNYPQLAINVRTHPGLADHVIKGEPIMPAAGFVEMALEYGASEVYDVQFHGLLALSSERPVPVQVKLEGTRWSVSSASSTDYAATWPIQYNRLHATGFLSMEPIRDRGVAPLDLDAIRGRLKPVAMSGFYAELSSFANYGPMYRRIRRCYMGRGVAGAVEALAEIRGGDKDIPNCSDYRVHPAILDAAIHVPVHPALTGNYDPNLYHLPSRLGAFRLCPGYENRPFPSIVFSHATFVSWTPDTLTYNFTIADERGIPICVVDGLTVALHGYRMKPLDKRFDVLYRPTDISLSSYKDGLPNGNGHANIGETPSLLIDYVRGEELKVQKQIAEYDPLQPLSLLLVAEEGLSGDAAQGFTRSLRKEYPVWTIRIVAFDASWTDTQRHSAAKSLLFRQTEDVEMRVDAEGAVSAPRIELAPAPATHVPLDLEKPWKFENGKVSHVSLFQSTDPDDLVVRVEAVTSRAGPHWAYVGHAVGDDSRSVVGISSSPLASHLTVHRASFVDCPSGIFAGDDHLAGPPILAATIAALAVGVQSFAKPERLRGKCVLLVDTDDELRSQIQAVLTNLGVDVLSSSSLSAPELESCYEKRPFVVLSGTRDVQETSVLRAVLAPRGRLLLWNHPEEGIASLSENDPWAFGDALRHAVDCRGILPVKYTRPADLMAELPRTVSPSPDLFDPAKSYLLVGGIGSLGLHMALWMYEKGAREIILTSRTGVESLDKRGDYIAQRILIYLKSRTDMNIRTVAVDAASKDAMAALVSSIAKPLGGCVLLAALLVDGMLNSHTAESFERAFTPKVDAFLALEQTVNLDSLDFLITFSSVSGLFGNPGQTSYAAANSALAGLTRKYRNAFSIVAPLILDSRVLTLSDDSYNSRVRHMIKWGMTARDLCDCIGDGIRKLNDGPVWQYIPDLDWKAVRDNMGPSPLYDHLVPADATAEAQPVTDKKASLSQIVCRVLDLKEADISIDVPLTTYGLDSLSAAALSFALRPLLSVSQVQLLADLAIKDLQARMESAVAPGLQKE